MRERYKDKPQEMQQEMMRIYREEKVNPMGGCLPIMVQIPVFIALYWVLLSVVEMRDAPWIGWIHDLSAPDPYFILPVVMTLTTLLQTALNPTPPDPMQAKLMWFMPLAFSVMFFFFPAGLVLYWITNNVLSIAQQWLINTRMGVPPRVQPAEVPVACEQGPRIAALFAEGIARHAMLAAPPTNRSPPSPPPPAAAPSASCGCPARGVAPVDRRRSAAAR